MTGHAILLGVSEVDKKHYGFRKLLYCAIDDVNGMYSLLESTKLYPKKNMIPLCGPDANWKHLCKELSRLSNLSKTEDIFLVVYVSCHGVYMIKDKDGKRCEMLCLYDQIIMEQQLHELLAGFGKASKIVGIIDSCYSGGLDDLKIFSDSFDFGKAKVIKEEERESVLQRHWDNLYEELISYYLHEQYEFNAETCFLMACEKEQIALAGGRGAPSYYTGHLLINFEQLPELGNYHAFQNWLKHHSYRDHSPKIKVRNKQKLSHFDHYEPFKFTTMTEKDVIPARTWKVDTVENEDQFVTFKLEAPTGKFKFVHEDVKESGSYLTTTLEVKEHDEGRSTLNIPSEAVVSEEEGLFDYSKIEILNRSTGRKEPTDRNRTRGRVRNGMGGGGINPGN